MATEAALSANQPDKVISKRRWCQFRLRTVLLLLLVLAIPGGWFVNRLHRANRQREARQALYEAFKRQPILAPDEWRPPNISFLVFDWQLDSNGRIVADDRLSNSSMPSWLVDPKLVDFFNDVVQGSIDLAQDEDLRHVRNLDGLRKLYLSGQVTDAGIEQLTSMTQLKELTLHGTRVTDAGLEKLKRALPGCKIVGG